MPYRTNESVPHTPYISDEEVQQLRDLWRPSVQANYKPWVSMSGEGGRVHRPDGYDSTQTSLWVDYPMYVVPPAVAGPVMEELRGIEAESPLFDRYYDRDGALLQSARRFFQRFVQRQAERSTDRFLRLNFDHEHGSGELNPGRTPEISVDAPILERGIDFSIGPVRRLVAGLDDYYGGLAFGEVRDERVNREGILGWTIPRTTKAFEWVSSLLIAKNHVVEAHWYMGPPEKLGLYFQLPQLSRDGEVRLLELIAEHEGELPEGTDYSEVYDYHPRLEEDDLYAWKRTWMYTDEERDSTRRMIEREDQRLAQLFPQRF